MGMIHAGSLHLPDVGCTHSLCIPGNGSTEGLGLLNGPLVSVWWRAVWVLDTSLLWWESMDALIVSSCPMATFISLCNWSISSDRVPGSALGWVSDHGVEATLATVGLFDTGGGDGEWLVGTEMWRLSGMAMNYGTYKQVAISWDCSLQSEWVFYFGGGGVCKATDSSFFLGVLCWETDVEVVGEVHCSCSKAPWTWRLRVLVIVGWGSMVEMRDGAGVVLIPLGLVLHKSTSIMAGSWVASPALATSQNSSSLKSDTKALTAVFNPLGRPPTPCIVVTSILVTGGGCCKGSFGVCLPSGCWGVPHWIAACAIWHFSSGKGIWPVWAFVCQ